MKLKYGKQAELKSKDEIKKFWNGDLEWGKDGDGDMKLTGTMRRKDGGTVLGKKSSKQEADAQSG